MSSETEELRAEMRQSIDQVRQEMQAGFSHIREMLVPLGKLEKYRFVQAHIERHGYITWSKVKDNPEFQRLFKSPTQFNRDMGQWLVSNDWRRKSIAGNNYYYHSGYNIDGLAKRAQWRRYKATDHKLHEFLIREVILVNAEINLLSFLRSVYPEKGERWYDDVIDHVAALIKKSHPGIERDHDIFRVVR